MKYHERLNMKEENDPRPCLMFLIIFNSIVVGLLIGVLTMVYLNPEIIADKVPKTVEQVKADPKNFLGVD
jgi:hypothetical protein